jgi:hypothetical protein
LNILGGTLGVEFVPTVNSYIRLEGRELVAGKDQNIFNRDGKRANSRLEVNLNMGISW